MDLLTEEERAYVERMRIIRDEYKELSKEPIENDIALLNLVAVLGERIGGFFQILDRISPQEKSE